MLNKVKCSTPRPKFLLQGRGAEVQVKISGLGKRLNPKFWPGGQGQKVKAEASVMRPRQKFCSGGLNISANNSY